MAVLKAAEAAQMRKEPDGLTDNNQITRVKTPVETAIDAEAATNPGIAQEKVSNDVPDPPPNGGRLAWMQVLG